MTTPKFDPADLEPLKRQLRAELREELRAEMKREMKTELARLFQVFANFVAQSASNDGGEPARGLTFRPRKGGAATPSPSAQAAATKHLRKIGMLP